VSSGRAHAGVSLLAGAGLAAAWQLEPTAAEVIGLTLLAGVAPDVDNGRSLAGRWIPQWIARDVELSGYPWHGRRLFGLLLIPHRGPTHSLLLGLGLAILIGSAWGPRWGLAFLCGWDLHLLLDPGAKMLLWPLWWGWLR
jgi:membrane-bound metal-dependent hydrolase YbcI (DUF457 family)